MHVVRNAKWAGTGIDCIPNHTHISRYSKFNRARLFAELPARQSHLYLMIVMITHYLQLVPLDCSRIQFYASIFQSLAATEARFHSEMSKVDEEFAGLMDGLANEAATAIHTTKKERTLDST